MSTKIVRNLSDTVLINLYGFLTRALDSGDRTTKQLRSIVEDEVWSRGLQGGDWLESLSRPSSGTYRPGVDP